MVNKKISVTNKALKIPESKNEDLPLWEIILSFSVWVFNIIYAFYNVYHASKAHMNQLLFGGNFEPGWSILGPILKDSTDIEWNHFNNRLSKIICCFAIHSISYRILNHNFPLEIGKIIGSIIDFLLLILIHGLYAVSVQVINGFLLYLICIKLIRREIVAWILAGVFFYCFSNNWYGIFGDDFERYDFQVLLSYKLLQFVSFASYSCRNKDQNLSKFFQYCTYVPYSSILIVNYVDYKEQMCNRSEIDWKKCACLALRLTFWVCFLNFLLHFFYIHSLMTNIEVLKIVSVPEMCSIGYVVGQIFHLKYVCIFGLNALFAFLDGMRPPYPPICISRVTFYSNMWRYFDRGLYSFLVNHIFKPLSAMMCGKFQGWRRISTTTICFSFIWLWHGADSNLFYWSLFHFVNILLEKLGDNFRICNQSLIENHFSKVWRLRCESLWSVVCVTWSLFAMFYFLGGPETGHIFFARLIVGQLFHMTIPTIYVLTLGYFFGNCCCFLDRYFSRRSKTL